MLAVRGAPLAVSGDWYMTNVEIFVFFVMPFVAIGFGWLISALTRPCRPRSSATSL
jgi:hypothetical protein